LDVLFDKSSNLQEIAIEEKYATNHFQNTFLCAHHQYHGSKSLTHTMKAVRSMQYPQSSSTKRNLNVDDEVTKYRRHAGWYDDDVRMKAFNDGNLSSTSSYKDKQYWVNILSTVGAFIAALLVMYGFLQYLKYSLGSNDNASTTVDEEISPRMDRPHRSRSRSRRSKSRRSSRSRSYHRRKDYKRGETDVSSTVTHPAYYPEDHAHPPITATEYTLMDPGRGGDTEHSEVGMNNMPVVNTTEVEMMNTPISPTNTEGTSLDPVSVRSPGSYLGYSSIT
jgi:hypothetical protein